MCATTLDRTGRLKKQPPAQSFDEALAHTKQVAKGKAKSKQQPLEQLGAQAATPFEPVELGEENVFGLKALSRHPYNRIPLQADVDRMAESLRTEGQLEAITVQMIGGGEWRILSGETRYLAAKQGKKR